MRVASLLLLVVAIGTAEAAPSPEDERQARSLYERGMASYEVREFDRAISDFTAAYVLTHEPGLLFNLGQASRLADRPEEAVYFYRGYLRQRPDAPNRQDVEEFIERLATRVEAPVVRPAPSVPVVPPQASVVTPTYVPPARRRIFNGPVQVGVGIGLMGIGVAAVIAGVVVGTQATADAAHISDGAAHGVAWNPQLRAEWNAGQRDAKIAIALDVVGVATAATGALLTALGAHKMARTGLAAAPTRDGMRVAWTYAF